MGFWLSGFWGVGILVATRFLFILLFILLFFFFFFFFRNYIFINEQGKRSKKFIRGYKIKKLADMVSAVFFAGVVHRCDEILIRNFCEEGTRFTLALLKIRRKALRGIGSNIYRYII